MLLLAESFRIHSEPTEIMNSAFVNLLKIWKLTYVSSSGNKTYFMLLIAKEFTSNTLKLEKHCKQYWQNVFYHDVLFC